MGYADFLLWEDGDGDDRVLTVKNILPKPTSREEARRIRQVCRQKLRTTSYLRCLAGTAIRFMSTGCAEVVVSVVSVANWSVVHEKRNIVSSCYPEDPAFSDFREAALLLAVLEGLAVVPDVILVQGEGMADASGFGVACHVGLALEHPTVGVTLESLGRQEATESVLAKRRGSTARLRDNVRMGAVVRTQNNEDPIYVSPGHQISIEAAVELALHASPWYRAPEPIRRANERLHLCAGV